MTDKILVTGGAGRLGWHVVEEMKTGAELTVLDICAPRQDLPYIEGSVLDFGLLQKSFQGQDVVVHLAAIPNPRTAPADVTFQTNVQGTWNVLQAAEEAGVRRVVVISSDAATGLHYNPENWQPQYVPVDEKHPLRPTDFYSLSKEVTEVVCRSYALRGKTEIVVIRPTHIVFEFEYPELHDRGADLENYHFWTYVSPWDVAQGIEKAAKVPGINGEIFFISAEDSLGDEPLLDRVRKRWGITGDAVHKPEVYAANPTASLLDISAAREKLGYAPRVNWRDMVAKVAATAE